MKAIDASTALDLLRSGQPLQGVHVDTLDLHALAGDEQDDVRTPIMVCDSRVDALDATGLTFQQPLVFERCRLGHALLHGTFFRAGVQFTGCVFEGPVTFSCGGHNEHPAVFVLKDCTFSHFVDFFDSWFMGPVDIRGCHFLAGTNLLGNIGQPFMTSFDLPPVIEDTSGTLAMNDDVRASS